MGSASEKEEEKIVEEKVSSSKKSNKKKKQSPKRKAALEAAKTKADPSSSSSEIEERNEVTADILQENVLAGYVPQRRAAVKATANLKDADKPMTKKEEELVLFGEPE